MIGGNHDVQSFIKDLKKKRTKKEKEKKRKRSQDFSPSSNMKTSPGKTGSETRKRQDESEGNISEKKRRRSIEEINYNGGPMKSTSRSSSSPKNLPAHSYIVAPMVGASELPFRLLCRKYGADLAYTPMMSSEKFAYDANYRKEEHPTVPESLADDPLVIHLAANNPNDFADAAVVAEQKYNAAAVDLNLGCPQRTAYVGHFGSYLLDPKDRKLICDIVSAASKAVKSIPIFCKIRLLNKIEDTIELVQQLKDAGASLIAIHARYRASWERQGPGARDGPAMLDQVAKIREAVPGIQIITNGNTITWEDVVNNLELTGADGLMSAEGILDNPALFLPRYGSREEGEKCIKVWSLVEKKKSKSTKADSGDDFNSAPGVSSNKDAENRKKRKLLKKLKKLAQLEQKMKENGENSLTEKEKKKLESKPSKERKLAKLLQQETKENSSSFDQRWHMEQVSVSLGSLYDAADDKLQLAMEYLDLASAYPVKIRSIIFHVRRMVKDDLVKYQLMEECLACESVDQIRTAILHKIKHYRETPNAFVYDREKAKQEREALERKKREEGKRKAYEARMIRKAKREGKSDLTHYLKIGAKVPTVEDLERFRSMPREKMLEVWKKDHSQHCLSFHIEANGCQRGRTCAFLHVDVGSRASSFVERDEVAG